MISQVAFTRAIGVSPMRISHVFTGTRPVTTEPALGMITLAANHASRYYRMAIRSFRCPDTQALFELESPARFVNIERPALRELKQLDVARRLDDMRAPPGNRLEPLAGDRQGWWSVRINDQFRLCFRWTGADAEDAEIVDYH